MKKCRHLTGNQLAMTSKEILKADVLDILFDNRNKNYGAYILRKYYNNRLGIALAGMIGFVLIVILVVSLNSELGKAISYMTDTKSRPVIVLPPPPPEPPPPPIEPSRPNVRTENFVNRIEIVNEPTNMPDDTQIEDAAISNHEQDGAAVGNAQPPNLDEAPASHPLSIEAIQTSSPAPSSPAAYPGGPEAWAAFLNRHLRTPDELDAGQKKTVIVRFAVGVDGSITQFEILQSGGTAFDNEVIRVLKKMPKWKPAVQNGQTVPVMFTQPVTFVAYEE